MRAPRAASASHAPSAESIIPLVAPYLDARDVASMRAAVDAGPYDEGLEITDFATRLAGVMERDFITLTDSCTHALVLALRALNVEEGDLVWVPTYSCLALLHALERVGAVPQLYDGHFDVASANFNGSPPAELLSGVGKAAIWVPMFGNPGGAEQWSAVPIPVIADVTLTFGARQSGRPVGDFADIVVSSFHATKMISCGRGGVLATKDSSLHERVQGLNGWQAEQVAVRTDDARNRRYTTVYDFRMPRVGAALGLSQLAKLDWFLERRAAIAAHYSAGLRDYDVTTPQTETAPSTFFRYMVEIQHGTVPDFLGSLSSFGVEGGRGVFPPLHDALGEDGASYPMAERCVASLVSLPVHPALSDLDVERVLRAAQMASERAR